MFIEHCKRDHEYPAICCQEGIVTAACKVREFAPLDKL